MKETEEIDLLLEEVEKTPEEVADCFFSVFPRVEKQKTIQVQEKFLLQTYEFRLPSSMDRFAVEFPCLPAAFSFRNALCIPKQNFDQAASGVSLERTNATDNVELDLVLSKECSLESLPNLFGTDLVDFVENRPKVIKVRVFVTSDQRRRRSRDNGDYDYDYYDFNEDENDAFSPSFVFGIESKCDIMISSARRIGQQETNWRGLFQEDPVAIKSRRRRHLIGLSGSYNQFYKSLDSSNFELELSVELLDRACRISSSAFFVDLDPP
ncbi:Oidioi.mRNA.OKI2018_I69.chr2.g5344.t1.cds [Oikopleura dioica]|uniref:Oidioi.mRNA.OKI2018_I69.chr2.g5344.t1.cds n=1 Tax=Oikopleura dioica TaxID=34765 RepID=A0ABN7T5Z7_OIKDI|nr:Oidioi.mRNA.OKI2018_I69.chr2.g5344.t1.cds [Oikopleura dioica]